VLRGVSISVQRGECYGLAGPNGAGKTTLIRVLLGLTTPDEGEVRVLGRRADEPEVRRRIGFVPEAAELPPAASPRQLVRRFARLRGLDLREAEPQGLAQLERMGMAELLDRPAQKLSKGEKQRTLLALSLLGAPELLVLDEPTDGLDPLGRALVRRVLREERERGRTVFLNSHLLSETERVCTRVGILHRGQLVREETVRGFAGDVVGPTAVSLASGETKLIEHDGLAQLNARLDELRSSGALLSEVQRVGRDLEASFEAAVSGQMRSPPDPGPAPAAPEGSRRDPLRPLRAALRVAGEIGSDLAARRIGWVALALAALLLGLFVLAVRSEVAMGAAAAVRRFGGPPGTSDEAALASWVGRYSASLLFWSLVPGSAVFAALFAPPLLDPRRSILLLSQPVSRGDVAAGIYATVCAVVLVELGFLLGLFFGALRWLGVPVPASLLLAVAPLWVAFAALYAAALAATYAVRSGPVAAAAGLGVFVAASLVGSGQQAAGRIAAAAVLPRLVPLSQQAMRLGAGEAPRLSPFALTAAFAAAMFLVLIFLARRSER
jgi:ABC-2 type transport system ATP-binding protein